MKINKLASVYLKSMVKDFSKTGKYDFSYNYFLNLDTTIEKHWVNLALYKLKKDKFVNILDADNIPYTTILLVDGIVDIQENTFLAKGYRYFKEIMDLIK